MSFCTLRFIHNTVAHNLKKFISILIISLFIVSCRHIESSSLISEFKKKEEYRIWLNTKSINKKDSVYHETKTFKSFDVNNRLINEGNYKFYYYEGESNSIKKTKSIFKNRLNVHFRTEIYDYNKKGLLQHIIKIGKSNDTIQSFRYNEKGDLIESKTDYRKITQEFENGLLKKKIEIETNTEPRISEFKYDSLKRLIIENWVFSGNHKMKTRFKYKDNKLFQEIDSTYVQDGNPNQYIEFMTEYKYDKNDSISEIIKLGRIKSESIFKIRGRKIFERILDKKE